MRGYFTSVMRARRGCTGRGSQVAGLHSVEVLIHPIAPRYARSMDSDFRNLIVWKRAMDLADAVYDAAAKLPKSEEYILSAQMRDAALSIPTNIAEGKGRWSTREYRQFVRYARGSTLELESHLLFAERRSFLTHDEVEELLAKAQAVVQRINGLLRYLNKRVMRPRDQRPATEARITAPSPSPHAPASPPEPASSYSPP